MGWNGSSTELHHGSKMDKVGMDLVLVKVSMCFLRERKSEPGELQYKFVPKSCLKKVIVIVIVDLYFKS